MWLKSQIFVVFVFLAGCKTSLVRDSQFHTLSLLANPTTVVKQVCQVKDSSPLNQSFLITNTVSSRGHVFEVRRKDSEVVISVSSQGVTAYEFSEGEATGISSVKAHIDSLREIFQLAKKYKRFSSVAREIVENHSMRRTPTDIEFAGSPIVNVSLGFKEENGELGSSFFWQGILPHPVKSFRANRVIPHPNDRVLDLKTPFKFRFFSEFSDDSEHIHVTWFEKDYFVEEVTWSIEKKGTKFVRSLECKEPTQNISTEEILKHERQLSKVSEFMGEKIVGSKGGGAVEDGMTAMTLENFARLSGMSLIDPKDYDWNDANYLKAKVQFLKGSLVGLCLRYQNLLQQQVETRMCEDKELKEIFSSERSKMSFVTNLSANVQSMIDGYNLPLTFSSAYPGKSADVMKDYLKWRNEICIAPLEPIFLKMNSFSCDTI